MTTQGLGLVEAPGGLLSALPHSRVVPHLQDLTSLTVRPMQLCKCIRIFPNALVRLL